MTQGGALRTVPPMKAPRAISSLAFVIVCAVGATAFSKPCEVIINRKALGRAHIQQIQQKLGAKLLCGRFWYDARSGAWGRESGPAKGLLPAGLPVGGRLWVRASAGNTGVVVNGRELHRTDVARLVTAGVRVQRGRYWLDANGVGGYEGGPALFRLGAPSRSRSRGRSARKSVLSTYDLTGLAVY